MAVCAAEIVEMTTSNSDYTLIKSVSQFREKRGQPAIDHAGDDDLTVLKRYDEALRAQVAAGRVLDGSVLDKKGVIDYALAYAFQGSTYFDELQMNLNYTVLHAALLLTISLPSFLDPPDFDDEDNAHIFLFFMGFSAMAHILSILSATMFSTALSRPYTALDTLLARTNDFLFLVSIITDYVGTTSLMLSFMVAAFNASLIDGYAQLYAIPSVVFIIIAWVYVLKDGDAHQLNACKRFTAEYCDASGQLTPESSRLIYPPSTLGDLLSSVGCEEYLTIFQAQKIDHETCLFMTGDDLEEIGVAAMSDRLILLREFDRLKKI